MTQRDKSSAPQPIRSEPSQRLCTNHRTPHCRSSDPNIRSKIAMGSVVGHISDDRFVNNPERRALFVSKIHRSSTAYRVFPTALGHALERQLGVVTLVSNQERRALVVPLINRG